MPTESYVVSFDFRIDSLGNFNRETDSVAISGAQNATVESDTNTGWTIRAVGNEAPKNWTFITGSGKNKKQIDSDIPVREGNVYSFQITVDPQAKTWEPAIGVNGGKVKNIQGHENLRIPQSQENHLLANTKFPMANGR